jgi:hypothetical protein
MYSSDAICFKNSVDYLSIPQFCKLKSFMRIHVVMKVVQPSVCLSVHLCVCMVSVLLPLDRFR